MAIRTETTINIVAPQDPQDTSDGNTIMVTPLLPQEPPDDPPAPPPAPIDITPPLSIIGVILNRGNTGANVQVLHHQLSALGAVIAPSEQTAQLYGDSTAVAVRAFRQQYGLLVGDTLDLSTGRLMRAPELPYPENFYTYRRDFYPLDVLNDVQRQIAAVGQPPRSANQVYPPPAPWGPR